ncbi:Succinyl-CoA:3-ketoacid-coenzyme A transferase subunit A [Cystobacter fuscus DSM 2262]|uniref:Succinyl-CoA:3-ketoacid-coenzyme A transferase subunit A n=1 Tax=Cystobacter fuscus (strain ATCC 25194 / DSM 2262 / NBRC 100088 / M29) TaxID=1242864 RepID=S9P387_CYSF2|nr:CoA transferase subunit A [Cystobacter fuscus]EPX56717.1 Succinyl-CoA:3-ketoacid-coenzyme A transferase subunit A [Cystobacter fuscus DSM 2262]
MNKIIPSADEAVRDMPDGCTLMSGGFGLCGNPETLIAAINRKGTKGLTIISNNCGTTELGLGILLNSKQVKKIVASYVGENKEFERQLISKELEVELNPQGTLAERIRAGGSGIGGFFTPSGAGTELAKGKETRMIDGRLHVLELPLKADFTIVRAWKADTWGNLVFNKTARNFSPMMCMAGRTTIVEAEHIVPAGEIGPDEVHVPGIFVHRIVQAKDLQKWIERRTVQKKA